jgi:hypothetical protein
VGSAAAWLAGCQASPAALEWRIELDPPSLVTRAAVVDARILGGGCDGVEVFGRELRPGAAMYPEPPPLGAGVWGFAAAAHDATCVRFAYDCVEVTLPGPGVVVDHLVPIGETQVCTPPRCRLGGCRLEDFDGDGLEGCFEGQDPASCDCDDANRDVHPGADDPCDDGRDQDCDGDDDLCDADCDGYPAEEPGSTHSADCNDAVVGVHPNTDVTELWALADGDRRARGCESSPTPDAASDTCAPGPGGDPVGDGIDQDCNLLPDDGAGCADPDDRDQDGASVCRTGETTDCDPDDCNPGVFPGREEVCGNALDEDADGMAQPCDPGDTDGDGHLPLAMGGDDCDDGDPLTYAGAPENCLTAASESCTENIGCTEFGGDADGDGYLAGLPAGARGDCEDRPAFTVGGVVLAGADIHPFAGADPCDGIDQDCDGVVDEMLPILMPMPGEAPDGCVRVGGGASAVDFEATGAYSEYCGGCGVVTAPNEDCCAGAPTPVDAPGQCGECGYDCGPSTECWMEGVDAGGNVYACRCAFSETADWADCDGSLLGASGGNGCEADLRTNAAHCGACGRACAPGQRCVGGACECMPPFLDCDEDPANGCEVNASNDGGNCGRCGTRCGAAHGSTTCRDGSCRISGCAGGWGNCNDSYGDGCETPLDELGDCGACGERCEGVLNATASCNAGRCDYATCAAGFGDCDGNRANGCEASLATTAHCGSCADGCGEGEVCNASGNCACGTLSRPSGPACAPDTICEVGPLVCVPI